MRVGMIADLEYSRHSLDVYVLLTRGSEGERKNDRRFAWNNNQLATRSGCSARSIDRYHRSLVRQQEERRKVISIDDLHLYFTTSTLVFKTRLLACLRRVENGERL